MSLDYDKARGVLSRLVQAVEEQEKERSKNWENDETTDEEKKENQEEIDLVRDAIETGGELLIDIAENLNKIAGGNQDLSRGRRQ